MGGAGRSGRRARLGAAAAAVAACLRPGALAYTCEGPGCCHATCGGGESCRETAAGPVPSWWRKDSCADLVSHNYDASIACSAAAAPGDPCGGDEPFACGYGLACVAETITAAHCAPLCDEHFADALLHADSVAAGCTLDVPRASFNNAIPGERVPVGDVTIIDGNIAVPACVADRNLYSAALARAGGGSAGPGHKAEHRPQTADHQARVELAAHVTALNLLFFEAQRAGKKPPDGQKTFEAVWRWKRPAFDKICPTYLSQLGGARAHELHLDHYAGHFQAGNAVIATGPAAFTLAQQALSMTHFLDALHGRRAVQARADPERCITPAFREHDLKQLTLRHLRHAGHSLAGAIVESDGARRFVLLTGVGDSASYGAAPTWDRAAAEQDACYFADEQHPAADVAAQVAAALAAIAHVLARHSVEMENSAGIVGEFTQKALHAFEYAADMYAEHKGAATCSRSSAATHCVGRCLDGAASPCRIYDNHKSPRQQLFLAAAALYQLTGDAHFRDEADHYFDERAGLFLTNWNSVYALGVAVLAGAADPVGDSAPQRPRSEYRRLLKRSVQQWSKCSEGGRVGDTCRRTEDGSAFPLTAPWGSTGAATSGVCMAALYLHQGFDDYEGAAMQGARCFMHRQLGFLTNHKCDREGEVCDTKGAPGYSYIVGLGEHFPTRTRSRDAAHSNFGTSVSDRHTLCGATVAGPWTEPGAVTDTYGNERDDFRESAVSIDNSAALMCAFWGYAEQPDGAFEHCGHVRAPLSDVGR